MRFRSEPGCWEQVSVAEPEQEVETASSRQREFSDDARFVQLLQRTLAQAWHHDWSVLAPSSVPARVDS